MVRTTSGKGGTSPASFGVIPVSVLQNGEIPGGLAASAINVQSGKPGPKDMANAAKLRRLTASIALIDPVVVENPQNDNEISIDDLLDRARAYFVAEENQPDEVVQIPIRKLAALMDRGGWSLVGGDFMEFEGNPAAFPFLRFDQSLTHFR